MKKTTEIAGCGTALVTPFRFGGGIDWSAFRDLIEWQIEDGIDFLVPCGTTGESVTLSEDEYTEVIATCVRQAGGRVPVVAGAGSNSTAHAVHLAQIAQEQGADALLSVTPYYNKPTQEGIFLHFERLAGEISIPVIIYNVPGRTATNILPETQIRLAAVGGILGVKEASGNLVQIMQILQRRPAGFCVLSGDDPIALPVTTLGGEGLISVAANVIPGPMAKMIRLAREGKNEDARAIHFRYLGLMNLNFIESNPIPVKYALSRMGKIAEEYRLPLCRLSAVHRKTMDGELHKLGLVTG